MTTNKPEQQHIKFLLELAQKRIDKRLRDNILDFYEKEDLPVQSLYIGLADAYSSLARGQFLKGEPKKLFRENFSKATGYVIKSFKMAYDENDPDYVGDKEPPDNSGFGYGCVDWAEVDEGHFINGINYALMGADFDIARELAELFRDPADGDLMDKEVNRYAHALKFAVMGAKDPAKALLKLTIDELKGKNTKEPYKVNYLTLSIALYGILDNDEAVFNEGLEMQLAFYQPYARGEYKDSENEFICDDAVALANLAIGFKMKVTAEHYTLPKWLVMQPKA